MLRDITKPMIIEKLNNEVFGIYHEKLLKGTASEEDINELLEKLKQLAKFGYTTPLYSFIDKFRNKGNYDLALICADKYIEYKGKGNRASVSYCLYKKGEILEERGQEEDKMAAIKLYEEAAEYDWGPAQEKLGLHYFEGIIVEVNYKKAYEYLKRIASKTHNCGAKIRALKIIMQMYKDGLGVVIKESEESEQIREQAKLDVDFIIQDDELVGSILNAMTFDETMIKGQTKGNGKTLTHVPSQQPKTS